jgi:hypothetical protein
VGVRACGTEKIRVPAQRHQEDETMANAELLRKTLRHIEANPDAWRQNVYREGDTGCFAYHASLLAGAELAQPDSHITTPEGGTTPNYSTTVAFNDAAQALGFDESDYIEIDDFARSALDMELEDADELFSASNTLGDLRLLVSEYAPPDDE